MKTIRQNLFEAIARASEATIDELLDAVDGMSRKQIQDNCIASRTEGLLASRKDDTTGLPAYRLTEAGKARLAKYHSGEVTQGMKPANKEKPKTQGKENAATLPKPTSKEKIAPTCNESLQVESVSPDYETLESQVMMLEAELKSVTATSNRNAAEVIKAGNLYEAECAHSTLLSAALSDAQGRISELEEDQQREQTKLTAVLAEIARLKASLDDALLAELASPIAMGSIESDSVNHPAHYTAHPSGIECIQITEHMGFCVGNAIKYLWRAGKKGNAAEDLAKAKWYIEREMQRAAA